MQDSLVNAVLLVALTVLSSCGKTPSARLPIRSDCAKSPICKDQGKGWVIVEVDVAPSGGVESAEVVEACPDDGFNWGAVNAVKKWKWKASPDGRQDLQMALCRP